MEEHNILKTGEGTFPIHEDVALLLTTSGTTGSPKLVKLSYQNLQSGMEYARECLNIQSKQKSMAILPLNYVYGLSVYLWHWYCGATVLITEYPIISEQFNEFFKREKVNSLATVPFTYQLLNKICFWDKEKLECLNWAMAGGAQLTEADQKAIVSIMKEKFWIGYGQTETFSLVCGTNFDEKNLKIGTIGKPVKDVTMLIDDITGELIVKSKSICMGYAYNKEQLLESDQNNGVWHTGDLAIIDEEGYVFLKGRLTRDIKILGKRINMDEIERYLSNKILDNKFACV